MSRLARYLATLIALSVMLAAIGLLAVLAHPAAVLTIVYPATGMGFAILWRFGVRWWPALLVAQFIVSLYASGSVPIATVTSSIEMATCFLLLWILTRLRVSHELARLQDLILFTGATLGATALEGVAIGIAEYLFGAGGFGAVARDGVYWWAGDAISIAVFTPLVTTWRSWQFLRPGRFRIVAIFSVALLALGMAITFGREQSKAALFLLLPIVIVNALLASVAGAASSGAVLTLTLIAFAMSGSSELDLFIRLIFVATATLTGYVLGIVWNEREQTGRQLEHLARHDVLTGIFNRYEFENRLREMLSDEGRAGHALLYLDLDQFKLVNDRCGHMAGDNMLKEVAQQFALVLPPRPLLPREGGGTQRNAGLSPRGRGDAHLARGDSRGLAGRTGPGQRKAHAVLPADRRHRPPRGRSASVQSAVAARGGRAVAVGVGVSPARAALRADGAHRSLGPGESVRVSRLRRRSGVAVVDQHLRHDAESAVVLRLRDVDAREIRNRGLAHLARDHRGRGDSALRQGVEAMRRLRADSRSRSTTSAPVWRASDTCTNCRCPIRQRRSSLTRSCGSRSSGE